VACDHHTHHRCRHHNHHHPHRRGGHGAAWSGLRDEEGDGDGRSDGESDDSDDIFGAAAVVAATAAAAAKVAPACKAAVPYHCSAHDPAAAASALSSRACERMAAGAKSTPFGEALGKAWGNEYDREMNPEGWINLAVAENRLTTSLVQSAIANACPLSTKDIFYPDTWHGTPAFRKTLANFLCKHVMHVSFSPDHLVVAAGATAVFDLLGHVLCNAGDAVLVPSPMYNGFIDDLQRRADVSVFNAPTAPEHMFAGTARAISRAWRKLSAAERGRVKAVLICNPNNPTGEVLESSEIGRIVAWTRKRHLQLIFDEVYAMSLHLKQPDASAVTPFISVAEVLRGDLGRDVHIVWGLSKDFCAAGARIGVLLSQNSEVLSACQKFSKGCSVSTNAQHDMRCLLSDDSFVRRFVLANQKRLTDAKRNVIVHLDYWGIPYVPASAGFFLWIDLRRYMKPLSKGRSEKDAERYLWGLLAESKVLLNAGCDYFCDQPGWFRCCFAMVDEMTMYYAWIEKLGPVLKRLK
jgi:aspartate/methionine/tyrosine aminotransferase